MRFILDTNIVIPAEPTSADDIEEKTPVVTELIGSLSQGAHRWLIHPGTFEDVKRDKDVARRSLRSQLLAKYQVLSEPPPLSPSIAAELGAPEPGSNDDVDFRILSALQADCADYVVTNDERMRKRARRCGLGQRVISADEALSVVRALFPSLPVPPLHVRTLRAHNLRDSDRIFESLRSEYEGFDTWLRKCKKEERRVWVIERDGAYAGMCIVNEEAKPDLGLNGRASSCVQ